MVQQNDKISGPNGFNINHPDAPKRPQIVVAREDETPLLRAVRYMTEVDSRRPELRDAIRSHRKADDQQRSDASCDFIIDGVLNTLAKSTLSTATDFDSTDALVASVKTGITNRFEQKPDRGYALGE
jgi:hypothetical protein